MVKSLINPKISIPRNLPSWIFGQIPLFGYPSIPLVDAMNFRSLPDENRLTELCRSWAEALALLFLSVNKEKWALLALIPLLSQLKFKLDVWPTSCHMSTLVQVRLWPEEFYFVTSQVQIISHELESSHFLTFEIFVNNLVPEGHWTAVTTKNVKIRLSWNSMKLIWVTRFCETNPTVSSVSSSEN